MVYLFSEFGSHEVVFCIKVIDKCLKFAGLVQHLMKDLTELFDLFDGQSPVSIVQDLFDSGDELFGSLELMEYVQSFACHIVDGSADFVHDPLAKICIVVLLIRVYQLSCFLYSVFSDSFQTFVNVSPSFELIEQRVYLFFLFENDANEFL
jgi:hypothetical protein